MQLKWYSEQLFRHKQQLQQPVSYNYGQVLNHSSRKSGIGPSKAPKDYLLNWESEKATPSESFLPVQRCIHLWNFHGHIAWNTLHQQNMAQVEKRYSHARALLQIKTCVGSVQLLSHVWLFAIPWTTAYQASLSITNSQSLLKLMSIESVMPSNHLILCRPLLLLSSIFPNIRVFSNESVLHIRWPKYWSFSFSINPSNIQDWLPLGLTGWISLQSKELSRVFSNTAVQKHQFFGLQLSL